MSKRINIQGQAPNAAQLTLYTLEVSRPAGYKGVLKSFIIANANAAARTVELWVVPAGGAPAAANGILLDTNVPANGFISWNGELVFDTAGMTLQIEASAATSLTFTGMIEEIQEPIGDQ